MLRNKLVIVLLAVLAASVAVPFLLGLFPDHYSMRAAPSQVAVVWRDNEAFLFLEVARTARRTSVVAEKLGEALPLALRVSLDTPLSVSGESHAWRLAGGAPEHFEMKATNVWTRYLPYQNGIAAVWPELHARESKGYRWNGAAFVPLTKDEARELLPLGDGGSLMPEEFRSDPVARLHREMERFSGAGWSFDRLPLWDGGEHHLKFQTKAGEQVLTYRGPRAGSGDEEDEEAVWDRGAGPASLTLAGADGVETALYSSAAGWKALSKAEFFAEVPEDERGLLVSRRPMLFTGPLMVLGWIFSHLFFLIFWLPFLLPAYWALGFRSRTLKTMADTYDFQPATPGEFAGLDHAALEETTRAFEALGFAPVKDISVVPDAGRFEPDFSRLMAHPEMLCFVQIVQFFPHRGRPRPLTFVVHSVLEDDWSLSTAPRVTAALTYRARTPRATWFVVPGGTPAQVYEAHVRRRSEICAALNLRVATPTFPTYQGYALGRYAERRAALRKRGMLYGPREAIVFAVRPPREWLGDYAARSGPSPS